MSVIPKEIEDRYYNIIDLIKSFCDSYLNDEYKNLCINLCEEVCRKNPKGISRGKIDVWAPSIIHVVGKVNFLFDPSEAIHIKAKDLYSYFKVSGSSVSSKSNNISDLLDITPLDLKWTIPSNLSKNPLTWLVNLDGFITDIRYVPKEIQEKALKDGIISHIPEEKDINNDDITIDIDDDEIDIENLSSEDIEEFLELNSLIEMLDNNNLDNIINKCHLSKINNLRDMEEMLDTLEAEDDEYVPMPKCKIIPFPSKKN